MALILNLETATHNCAVSIGKDGAVLAHVHQSDDKYIHAEKLHAFIAEACQKANISLNSLDAVAVSNGPGSYTGLRIGVSAAKGLCYALQLPLIAVDTTRVFAQAAHAHNGAILSVIDARRNEVYAQLFADKNTAQSQISAVEVTPQSWPDLPENTLIVGDAADKTVQLLGRNIKVMQCLPQAADMVAVSEAYYLEKRFTDVAYHEPFYLKDFIAGKPRKML